MMHHFRAVYQRPNADIKHWNLAAEECYVIKMATTEQYLSATLWNITVWFRYVLDAFMWICLCGIIYKMVIYCYI